MEHIYKDPNNTHQHHNTYLMVRCLDVEKRSYSIDVKLVGLESEVSW
jgi:hypothetical protein